MAKPISEETFYRTFLETRQEPLRLTAALQGFFLPDTPERHRKEYLQYIKRRIRPAVEQLLKENALDKIQELERLNCFHEKELDVFLRSAREQGNTPALMWFLQLKNEKYGYRDRDFSL